MSGTQDDGGGEKDGKPLPPPTPIKIKYEDSYNNKPIDGTMGVRPSKKRDAETR